MDRMFLRNHKVFAYFDVYLKQISLMICDLKGFSTFSHQYARVQFTVYTFFPVEKNNYHK